MARNSECSTPSVTPSQDTRVGNEDYWVNSSGDLIHYTNINDESLRYILCKLSQDNHNKEWSEVHKMYPVLDQLEHEAVARGVVSEIRKGPNKSLTKANLETTGWTVEGHCNCSGCRCRRSRDSDDKFARWHTNTYDYHPRPAVPTYPTPTTTNTGVENTMSSATDKAKEAGATVWEAIKEGSTMAVVGETNRQALLALELQLDGKYPGLLKDDNVRKAVEVALPSLVIMGLAFDEHDFVPGKEFIEYIAKLAVTDAARDGVQELVTILFAMMFPVLEIYREAGHKMLADRIDGLQEEMDRAAQKQKEKIVVLREGNSD